MTAKKPPAKTANATKAPAKKRAGAKTTTKPKAKPPAAKVGFEYAGVKFKLNPKQKAFCELYRISKNATKSAQEAGYSQKTAYAIGQENLKKPEISAYISLLLSEDAKRNEVSQDRVVQEYAKIAFGGLGKFIKIDIDGNPRIDLSDASADDLNMLQSVTFDTNSTVVSSPDTDGDEQANVTTDVHTKVTVKLHNKTNALKDLGQHLGIFKPKQVELKTDALADVLAAIQGKGSVAPIKSDDDE